MSITDTKQDTKTKNASPSRENANQDRKDQRQTQTMAKQRVKVRLIPIWLRVVITILFMTFSLMAGTMVGYGVIGDGKPFDALKYSTWTHIIELINKEK